MIKILQQQSEISLVVLGEAMIRIAGRLDLSLESTVGLAPGVAVWLVLPGHGLGVELPGGWSIPIARGLLNGISRGQTFFGLPPSMLYLGTTEWLGLPASIWVSLLLLAPGIVVLGYTRFGRALYAVGGNSAAAKAAGAPSSAHSPGSCCSTSCRTS